jgi:hypothetical protein
MFQNRKAAERKAQEITRDRDYKTGSGKRSAQTQITNRKERELDEWVRKNVGLD